jgi:hypothetical protein
MKKSQNSRNQGFSYYFCLMIRDPDRDFRQTDPDPGGPRSRPTTLHLRRRRFLHYTLYCIFLCLARCHRGTRIGGLSPRPAPLSTPRPPCRPPAPHAAAQCSPASLIKGQCHENVKRDFLFFRVAHPHSFYPDPDPAF